MGSFGKPLAQNIAQNIVQNIAQKTVFAGVFQTDMAFRRQFAQLYIIGHESESLLYIA
jgi:hypothetical protein